MRRTEPLSARAARTRPRIVHPGRVMRAFAAVSRLPPVTWGASFRIRQYVRASLWVLPMVGGVLGVLLGTLDLRIEQSVDVPVYWQYSPSTASTVLASVVGATAALTGFVVTVTVLVVQMATGTFSARYMRLWYRDRMLKAVLATLVRNPDVLLRAPPPHRGELRAEHRGIGVGVPRVRERADVHALPRPLPAPAAPGGGGSAGGARRPPGVPSDR